MSDFSDHLIVPRFSTIKSRADVNISTQIGDLVLDVPVISANMACLTGPTMCRAMYENGGLGCLHRFFPVEETKKIHESIEVPYIASIGVRREEWARFREFLRFGQKYFCIDVAHGAQEQVYEFLSAIRNSSPDVWIMVGNFGRRCFISEKIIELADAVKVGIGPGEACTTRKVAGVGVPQRIAIGSFAPKYEEDSYLLCADGGMRNSGDVAKAIAFGADFVMTGSLFKGACEAEDPYLYSGSASPISYRLQGKTQDYIASEGIDIDLRDCKPTTVREVMQQIAGGLRSALAYTGATDLESFRDMAEIVDVRQSYDR